MKPKQRFDSIKFLNKLGFSVWDHPRYELKYKGKTIFMEDEVYRIFAYAFYFWVKHRKEKGI